MKVELISFTPDALNLLLTTKGTRLAHTDDPASWSEAKKQEHLDYMRDTIKSSWEFVDYTFRISGVTRAFTHQLVRTRTGSYAQESQRTVDVSDHEVFRPFSLELNELGADQIWDDAINTVMGAYKDMIIAEIPVQDARGILPTNITTSIIAKFNLRTLHETAKTRMCTRTQGEYQDVFREMRKLVVAAHPWTDEFLQVYCVATGTCAFPRYGKDSCPVYLPGMDNGAIRRAASKLFWTLRHEAKPAAKEGKAQ